MNNDNLVYQQKARRQRLSYRLNQPELFAVVITL